MLLTSLRLFLLLPSPVSLLACSHSLGSPWDAISSLPKPLSSLESKMAVKIRSIAHHNRPALQATDMLNQRTNLSDHDSLTSSPL